MKPFGKSYHAKKLDEFERNLKENVKIEKKQL
jgi:hypothetical protein